MTLYRKHAQGPAVKGEFTLTYENVDRYHKMSQQMDEEVRWLKTVMNLRKKQASPDTSDCLYTPEYIARRLAKLEAQRPITDDISKHIRLLEEMVAIERDMGALRPLVFDKVEGQKVEHHERLSELTDRFTALEEEQNNIYGSKYPELKANLPKIYYMILEGVDIDTVNSCFTKMKSVLAGTLSSEDAANKLMDESQRKYNLPSTLYDPIRVKNRRA
jgi:hypothetical protein